MGLVEERLDNVVYRDDPGYIPSDFALEFVNFIKLVNAPDGEENETPVLHYRILDQIAGKTPRIANLIFRGAAKTSLVEYLILYLAVYNVLPGFGSIPLGLYVTDSVENGVKNMRKNLEHRWEMSEFLRQYVPKTRFTDVRWEFVNAEGKNLVIRGYGASTGVRGAKEKATRPVIAFIDDVVSDEDSRSDTVIASIEATIYQAVTYALHPTRFKMIWNGTPFNTKDPLYKAIESGAWAANVYPVCERFPCEEEEFKGAWEDRFHYDYVKSQYDVARKSGKISTFYQELMLRVMAEEDRLIAEEDIQWFRLALVLENRNRFNFYITTDFATTAKDSGDYSVIAVWAYNYNGDWFWVDGVVKRQTMDKNVEDLFRLAQAYKPQKVGVEVSGQQGGFVPWIQEQMMVRNNYFTLASENNSNKPGIRPTTNKMQRFNVVVPWFKNKKMYFPKEKQDTVELQEFMNEYRLASVNGFRSKQDDCIDTTSQLATLGAWKPSEEISLVKSTGSVGLTKGQQELDLWIDADEYTRPNSTRISSYVV